MDLLLSGRVIVADEARALGLVDRLYEPEDLLEEARSYARDLVVNCSPRSMAVIKRQLIDDWERGADESRRLAVRLMRDLEKEEDFVEGVRSFTEKRTPRFAGLSIEVDVEPEWVP
jgi:enoyl-CoA hydratase/carnithine racemase